MNYRIHHETRYRYGEPTTVSYNEVRLCPQNTGNQKLLCKNITVDPRPAEINKRSDYFGNLVWFVAIDRPHKEMRVAVDSHLKLTPRARPEKLSNSPAWEAARARVQHPREGAEIAAVEYLLDSPLVSASEALADYARPSFTPQRPLMRAINDLMARIYADFQFTPGFTNTATPLSEVIKHRKGVCQDFAQLAIGCLRSMGLPARYVSGYIETLPPPGKPKLQGVDASHAWFSAYIPTYGWLDFDPTNNQIPTDQHIVVGHGRDFSDVSPIKGVIFSAGRHELEVSVDVDRVESVGKYCR
jgi:transglutaminase-like putative cysteine protease